MPSANSDYPKKSCLGKRWRGAVVERTLRNILENVEGWLKFAEAKNTLVLVFGGGTLVGSIPLVKEFVTSLPLVRLMLCGFLVCVTGALILASCSMIPSLYPAFKADKGRLKPDDNLHYFEFIRLYSAKEYVETLARRYGYDEFDIRAVEVDLARSIVGDAVIISRKLAFFRVSIILLTVALVAISVSIALSVV